MTKEQTIYEIKKLINKYTKMRNNCNNEWNRLEESNFKHIYEDQIMLVTEQEVYLTLIADLSDLIKEIDNKER